MGDVIVFGRRKRAGANAEAQAQALYLEGCELDKDESTLDAAEAAYRKSLNLDPLHARSLTNLACILFRRGELTAAETMFLRATEIDRGLAEAQYNLGFLLSERGNWVSAVERFEAAVAADPEFADAHFNLAMSLTRTRRSDAASSHWERFLELQPTGEWSDIARRYQKFATR